MTHPDADAIVLPERVALDPVSAVALALSDALDEAEAAAPGPGMLALDFRKTSERILDALDRLGDAPRIPAWDQPRTVGGATSQAASGQPSLPDPEIVVDVDGTGVVLRVTFTAVRGMRDPGQPGEIVDLHAAARVPPADARAWFLAGLAACAAAETSGPYITPDVFTDVPQP